MRSRRSTGKVLGKLRVGRPTTPANTSVRPSLSASKSWARLRSRLKSPAMISGASAGTSASRREARASIAGGANVRTGTNGRRHNADVDRGPEPRIATMQHAAPFETQVSDVLVLRGDDRKAGTEWRCRDDHVRRRRCAHTLHFARRRRREIRVGDLAATRRALRRALCASLGLPEEDAMSGSSLCNCSRSS